MTAITTHALLLEAVADEAEREDLETRIPRWIGNFEARVQRWLRERKMQGQSTADVDTRLTALPTDFAEGIIVQVRVGVGDAWSKLDPAPSGVLANYEQDAATGRPRFWGAIGDQLLLHPTPDQSYSAQMTYYRKVPALTDANTTNWLLAAAPDAYLHGVMGEFFEWDRDYPAADRRRALANDALTQVQASDHMPAPKLRVPAGLAGRSGYSIHTDI